MTTPGAGLRPPPLDPAECVLCGVSYTRWIDADLYLMVVADPMSSDEIAMGRDVMACRARI